YVLKTSDLSRALANAGIDCHIDLHYWCPQGGGSILEGMYWLPNENVSYPRVYVRAGVVSSGAYKAARQALVASAVPEFVNWLRGILALPKNSPALYSSPYFNATFSDKGLTIANKPVYKVRRASR